MYLKWSKAEKLILNQIDKGLSLNPTSRYGRKVILTPPYKCNSKQFKGLEGYCIQVGKSKFLEVPIQMLEDIYIETINNRGDYNQRIFKKLYPKLTRDNPCYVHTVGKIFEMSGLVLNRKRNYWLKSYLSV